MIWIRDAVALRERLLEWRYIAQREIQRVSETNSPKKRSAQQGELGNTLWIRGQKTGWVGKMMVEG